MQHVHEMRTVTVTSTFTISTSPKNMSIVQSYACISPQETIFVELPRQTSSHEGGNPDSMGQLLYAAA